MSENQPFIGCILYSWKRAPEGTVWAQTSDGMWYRAVKLRYIKQVKPHRHILCIKEGCPNDAVFLDGQYPYENEYNRCLAHRPDNAS